MSSSTTEHFSHPEHPLTLKEDDVIRKDAMCFGCEKPVIGVPTYTCTSHDSSDCRSFYLHKSCAELPTLLNHHKHNQHPLTLLPRRSCVCNVCDRKWKLFTYTCADCHFDVCVDCAFLQRIICHEGHEVHSLTLMQREALFKCDACGVKSEDSSYVCTTCEFWIHKSCAFSPLIIPSPTYHHHPLNLIYSIPDMHRNFDRFCAICKLLVQRNYWLYYCHKCTYLVHMKCSTSTLSMVNDNEGDETGNELDLVQVPLLSEESLLDIIIAQCGKLQVDNQGEGESYITIPTKTNDPQIIEEHWSHKNHPLELLQFTISENNNDDNDDDKKELICDGCIQPITVSNPSYYACIKCDFFLHSFCATKLPNELPPGVSPFHPQHSLLLEQRDEFYFFVKCGVCSYSTNGFYYICETCDIKIDIRCAFLPSRITHKSHKHHSLVQRPFSNSNCSVSSFRIDSGVEYACETCSSFQISIKCAFYPLRMKHIFDIHSIKLREPPFFYEGVFYCELCEEQVNNQWLLYHCDDCDHSFHDYCLRSYDTIKLGGTIEFDIDNEPHTLALVLKNPQRNKSSRYICDNCGAIYHWNYFLECDGCGYLICCECVTKVMDE